MVPRQRREAIALEALSVALQHPAVAGDQQNICRLLQACQSWRKIVKQSRACITAVTYSRQLPSGSHAWTHASTMALAQFGHWLMANAGLVNSINIEFISERATSTGTQAAIDHLLSLGLHAAAGTSQHMLSTPFDSIAGTSATASAASTAASILFQLRSYKANDHIAQPLVLSALPAATLTGLTITVPGTARVYEALASLSCLQSLQLNCSYQCFADGIFNSISKLSRLTELEVASVQGTDRLPLLPLKLQKLQLTIQERADEPADLLISHLKRLQHFSAMIYKPIALSALPQQLRQLDIACLSPAISANNISSLQQLQHLTILWSQDSPQDLLSLKQLPHLETIELEYDNSTTALAAAPAWPQVEQLAALNLDVVCSAIDMAAVINAVCAVTRLTRLSLRLSANVLEGDPLVEAAVSTLSRICQSLKPLSKLKDLELSFGHWAPFHPDDMLHLSVLTALTRWPLEFDGFVDSTITIAVLAELSALQNLEVQGLQDTCALPVIGKMQGLTRLALWGLSQDVQVSCLRYLSRLRNLRKLDGFDACSEAEMRKFWADLRA